MTTDEALKVADRLERVSKTGCDLATIQLAKEVRELREQVKVWKERAHPLFAVTKIEG